MLLHPILAANLEFFKACSYLINTLTHDASKKDIYVNKSNHIFQLD